MKLSAYTIWYELNYTKITFNWEGGFSYLAFTDDDKLNQRNNE